VVAIYLEYSPSRIIVHRFTILQHINFTFDCSGPLPFGVFFTLTSLLWTDPSLSNYFSLNRFLLPRDECIRSRKHIHWLATSYNWLPRYALSCERVCRLDNDTGNLVTELLSSNGRQLRFRYNLAFRGTPHYLSLEVPMQSKNGCDYQLIS
jgi:hypothetical protein